MRRTTAGRTLALSASAMLLAGCFKLARESPPVERFVLGGALSAAAPSVGATTGGLTLGLRRLDIAPYLSTLAIVVRRADNEIVASGFHRWAENPAAGLNRAVAGYLSAAPSVRAVDVAPWAARLQQDLLLQLHVLHFEGVASDSGSAVHVQVRWEIIRPPDDLLVARGVTDVRTPDWPGGDYAGLVSRLDRGLVVVAADIVACLGRLPPGMTTVLECSAE